MDPRVETAFAAAAFGLIVTTAAVSLGGHLRRRVESSTGGSALLGPRVRTWYFTQLQPIEDFLAARRVAPTAITLTQALLSIPIAAAFAAGWLFTAGWLVLAVGSLDIIDGRLARRSGTASDRGAFLDSVFDRYADMLCFIGLAFYFRSTLVLGLVLFALLGSAMVSYARARAESLGVDGRAGLFQRPERTVVLGFGTIFSSLFDHAIGRWLNLGVDGLLIATLLVLALMTNVSALQRIREVARQLGGRP